MGLSFHQQALIFFLNKFDLEKGAILAISLMLAKSEEGIRAFIYLAGEEHITKQEDFLRLATEVAEVLPAEERVGIPMNLPIKS